MRSIDETEKDLLKAIASLKYLADSIKADPDRKMREDEIKIFMLSTTSAVMGLHILLSRWMEVRRN